MAKEIILVESGATKSDWRLLSPEGTEIKRFVRPGTNVSTMRLEEVQAILRETFSAEGLGEASGFYFYTAGVVTEEIAAALEQTVRAESAVSDIDIRNDVMGAARGVCGRDPGIVAILGTGSNTCFYDGKSLSQKVYSGGYVIGDEGSAASLGKLFLADFIKGLVPEEVAGAFSRSFDASYAGIVAGVYRSASPSKYLGSLAPFLLNLYAHPWVKALVDRNFQSFIQRSLLRYDVSAYQLGIVGGFGWACRDIFAPLCEQAGIRVSRFIKAPIDGLCDYHLGKF